MEAIYRLPGDSVHITPAVAIAAGQLIQLPDGRAAVAPVAIAAGDKGAVQVSGLADVVKTSGIVFLDGGDVYWDSSASAAHYKPVNDKDWHIGTAFGDVASTTTTMRVVLNQRPRWLIDLIRDAFLSVPTGTAAAGGFGYPTVLGGARQLVLTATNEAQCVDLLSVDRCAVSANPIVRGIIRVAANGSGAAVDFSLGIANGTSTTDADAVTEHVLFHIDGGSLDILAQSKDGTTTVTATDTTIDATAGSAVANRFEFWIDCRDPDDVKLYINGSRVLSGTTFKLTAATGPLGLLAHLEKTSGTTTGTFVVDALQLRIAEQ